MCVVSVTVSSCQWACGMQCVLIGSISPHTHPASSPAHPSASAALSRSKLIRGCCSWLLEEESSSPEKAVTTPSHQPQPGQAVGSMTGAFLQVQEGQGLDPTGQRIGGGLWHGNMGPPQPYPWLPLLPSRSTRTTGICLRCRRTSLRSWWKRWRETSRACWTGRCRP